MNDHSRYCIDVRKSIIDAIRLIEENHKKMVIVVEERRLKGVVTDGDIRRYLLTSGDFTVSVGKIMSANPIYLHESDRDRAQQCMDENLIDGIPIVDDAGIVTDIIFRYDELYSYKREVVPIHVPVVIMAGGKGTRLLPYTTILPKPLMPLGQKTVLEHIMESFYECGCDEFYLTVNYKKEIIRAYLNEVELPYHLRYVTEEEFMGTGGSLYYLKEQMNTTFIVSNCDVILNVDYADVIRRHREQGNKITLLVSRQNYNLPYGTVKISEDGQVLRLEEKPEMWFLVNTGVYVLEPDVLQDIEKTFIHMTEIIENVIQKGESVGAYLIEDGAWLDIGEREHLGKINDTYVFRRDE